MLAIRSSRRDNSRGFSLIELLVVIAVMGTLAAITVPIVISQRATSMDANQQADLRDVSAQVDTLLSGWRNSPPAQVTISSSSGTWNATPAGGSSVASGTLNNASDSVTGTVWIDGSYCLSSRSTSSATTYMLRSDTSTIVKNGTCPTTALGGAGTSNAASSATLPGQVTGLSATSPLPGKVNLTWTPVTGATSYIVKQTGAAAQTTTSAGLSLTGLPAGATSFAVYAKNANGTGQGATIGVTVASAPTYTKPVAASIVWNDMPLQNSWAPYSSVNVNDVFQRPQYTKNGGIVQVRGLIQSGTATAGTVIATLPAGYRPDYDLIFPTLNGTNMRDLYIHASDGTITLGSGGFTSTWITLDSIVFPAAGVASWTTVGSTGSGSAFQNSWADYARTAYGPARFWKDPDGVVWFGGLVSSGVTTDNTMIFTLPSGYNGWKEQHLIADSASTYGGVGTGPTLGGIVVKGNTSNAWISLAGVTLMTPDAMTKMTWYTSCSTQGGSYSLSILNWTNYNAANYPCLGYAQGSSGLVYLQGLGSGTYGSTSIFVLPADLRPLHTYLKPAMSGNVNGYNRIDIYNNGGVAFQAGQTGSWGSFDSQKFFPN